MKKNWRFAIKSDLDSEVGSRSEFWFWPAGVDDVTQKRFKLQNLRIERRKERERRIESERNKYQRDNKITENFSKSFFEQTEKKNLKCFARCESFNSPKVIKVISEKYYRHKKVSSTYAKKLKLCFGSTKRNFISTAQSLLVNWRWWRNDGWPYD